jgi:hypothetical protein
MSAPSSLLSLSTSIESADRYSWTWPGAMAIIAELMVATSTKCGARIQRPKK